MKRRDLIKGTIATGLVAGFGRQQQLAAAAPIDNPIVRENSNLGSTDWQLTRVRTDTRGGVRSSPIEGYCSRQSVAAGESIDIHVSTKPAQEFTIEIFRTGYYDGRGARLMRNHWAADGNDSADARVRSETTARVQMGTWRHARHSQ